MFNAFYVDIKNGLCYLFLCFLCQYDRFKTCLIIYIYKTLKKVVGLHYLNKKPRLCHHVISDRLQIVNNIPSTDLGQYTFKINLFNYHFIDIS